MVVINELISNILSGLNDRDIVKMLPDEQQAWDLQTDESCKVYVLKNISWTDRKQYIDKIELYACKHKKAMERIKELSG